MNELLFEQLICSIKYVFIHLLCFAAAFHRGGHTLVQKSIIDQARHHLDNLKNVNATGG